MNMWRKLFSLGLVIATIAMAGCNTRKSQECCLCDSPSYTALCIVDLDTGDILELGIPSVADAYGGESNVETFSVIRFGNVTGIKQTAPDVIELRIPAADQVEDPTLCTQCRNLLQEGYTGRYVLADLRDSESKMLMPIAGDAELILHSYQIAVKKDSENETINVTIRIASDTMK